MSWRARRLGRVSPIASPMPTSDRLASCRRYLALAGAMLVALVRPCLAAVKTDIVELTNGDRITCEIQKLERGKLTVKTDGVGTISIEWDDIARVSSLTTQYDIELSSGAHYYGSLVRGDLKILAVVTLSGQERLVMNDVIRISRIGGNFWKRLDGSIDGGFSFSQANLQTQWTFDTTVTYRGRRWLSSIEGDSLLTSSEDVDRQTRNNLTWRSERFLARRWSAVTFAAFQQNEELALNLRGVFGGGVQRETLQTNRTILSVVGGAAFTNEQYVGADVKSVAEAIAGSSWSFFTYDGRSTNLTVTAITYYALSEARFRLELNTSFKSDIVGDLYWSINLFESYNSKPPAGQKANDSGVSAAVGWSF